MNIMKYKFPPPMQMTGVSLTGSKLEISLLVVPMKTDAVTVYSGFSVQSIIRYQHKGEW